MSAVVGVLVAYLVLILHVLLLAFVIILILFFHTMVNYMVWGFIIGIFIPLCIFYYYKKINQRIFKLKKLTYNSKISDAPFEVNFFGGLASFKLDSSFLECKANSNLYTNLPQIDLNKPSKMRDITKLAGLLEKKLITVEEYNMAKREIFQI